MEDYDSYVKNVGKRLKESREKRGLTLWQLSMLIHISQSSISLWESGKRMPNPYYLMQVCEALDIDVSWLLGVEKDGKR